jgi:hypothetical protein
MNKEQEVNLFICKIQNSKKENQTAFLTHVLEYIPLHAEIAENVISVLEGKKINHKQTGLSIGDKFYIDLDEVSCYPKINKFYYDKNNLLINGSIIEVQFVRYNIFNRSIGIKVFTDLTIESVVDISDSYVIPKTNLNIV